MLMIESKIKIELTAKGKRVDATQELISLGMSNVCGSFISSMPITGSLSRCAVNYASGVQTQLGGLFTGGLILISLEYLTEVFRFIPKSILAAIIMSAILHMVDVQGTIEIWKSRSNNFINIMYGKIKDPYPCRFFFFLNRS